MHEPENTCPLINRTQRQIDDAIDTLKSVMGSDLEDIRRANSELRDWGQHWEGEAGELKTENERLKNAVETLQEENEELRTQLAELQANTKE